MHSGHVTYVDHLPGGGGADKLLSGDEVARLNPGKADSRREEERAKVVHRVTPHHIQAPLEACIPLLRYSVVMRG